MKSNLTDLEAFEWLFDVSFNQELLVKTDAD